MHWVRYLVALVGIGFFSNVSASPCDVIDDAQHALHLQQPAKRIISLAPDLTELLFAAGAGSALIGVMQGSDYPAAARRIPVVASYNRVNSEAILALHPDLVVAWAGGGSGAALQQLQALGVPIFLSHQRAVNDIPRTLRKLGCLAGTPRIADQAAATLTQQYDDLARRYAHAKPVCVFYEMWPHPLMTANKDSWINQIIQLCGGKPIFSGLRGAAPVVNLEAVLAANPAVIISTAGTADWQAIWHHWPALAAVRQQAMYAIPPDWLERAGPRLMLGAKAVCEAIDHSRHPS